MLKAIIIVFMLSVSTLAHADKWEYANFQRFLTTDGKVGMKLSYGRSHVTGFGSTLSEAEADFYKTMGWKWEPEGLTLFYNRLGMEGWELVGHETFGLQPGDRPVAWFKRRID